MGAMSTTAWAETQERSQSNSLKMGADKMWMLWARDTPENLAFAAATSLRQSPSPSSAKDEDMISRVATLDTATEQVSMKGLMSLEEDPGRTEPESIHAASFGATVLAVLAIGCRRWRRDMSRLRSNRRMGSVAVRRAVVTAEANVEHKEGSAYSEFYDLDRLFENEEEADDTPHESTGPVSAEEEICEVVGYELGDELISKIGREFEDDERQEAYKECGFTDAVSSERPQAIWLIGPSASGKSTLAPIAAGWAGISDEGYVTVDGEPFRDSHRGYQEALQEGKQKGCVWWGAYVGIRENVNDEKQDMLALAADERKHLVIPSTCLRRSQCVDVAEMLLERGYKVHIVGIYGNREEIVRRGQKRSVHKGKRYDPREFGMALRQFAPMLRLCTGEWKMMCSTNEDWKIPTDEGTGPLAEEEIERICRKIADAYHGHSMSL